MEHHAPPRLSSLRFTNLWLPNHWKALGFLALSALVSANLSAMSASLTPSTTPPFPLGSPVTWTAAVADADPGTLMYAFRVRPVNGIFRTVVDSGPKPSLDWTTIHQEGSYEIQVSIRNSATGETVTVTSPFTLGPLINGTTPAVSPSANPLVMIYSAPPCAAGGRMRVEFQPSGGAFQSTPWQACSPAHSMNFYLAGLRSAAPYAARHVLDSGTSMETSPSVAFQSSPTTIVTSQASNLTAFDPPVFDTVLLRSVIGGTSVAVDLTGNLVWSAPPDLSFLTRPQSGGTFLGIFQSQTAGPAHQIFREFDLAGVTLAETNAARVSEQLVARGLHPINSFHHEARRIAGGFLVLAASERILTDVQGPGDVDVLGDTIVVLNDNLQVTWAWDSFNHLDVRRMAVLNEVCTIPNGGCPPIYLAAQANDWLHGNALQLTPDGNILYSSRHQDWLIKIDYSNGEGTGDVLWRLGNQGDFQISSSDANPWFSHQHDANFARNNTSLTLFDDGNTRIANDPGGHSRGQMIVLDERSRIATLALNADVGSYSAAVGSAQELSNGDYHFDSGFILDANGKLSSQSIEVSPAGGIVFGLAFAAIDYRTFRMRDLYSCD